MLCNDTNSVAQNICTFCTLLLDEQGTKKNLTSHHKSPKKLFLQFLISAEWFCDGVSWVGSHLA